MRDGQEGNRAAFILLLMWWAIASNTEIENAFLTALFCQVNAWLAIKLFSRARFRIQNAAWALLGQAFAGAVIFLVLMPGALTANFVLVFAVGLPILFVTAGLRIFVERIELPGWLRRHAQYGVYAIMTVFAVPLWRDGLSFWAGLFGAGLLVGLGVGAAYLGWRFAEREPGETHDARFGSDTDFGRSGSSREL